MNFLGIAKFMKQFYSKQIWKKNWYVNNASALSLPPASADCSLPKSWPFLFQALNWPYKKMKCISRAGVG